MRETRRKLFHILVGTALALFYHYQLIGLAHFVAMLALALAGSFAYQQGWLRLFTPLVKAIERKQDLKTFPGIGAIYYLIGSTVSVSLYSKPIAVASILVLAWGDGIGHLLHMHGTIPSWRSYKKWEGIIGAILISTLAASFFVPFWQAALASTIALLLECIEVRIGKYKIDDNLYIPIIAGLVMTLT